MCRACHGGILICTKKFLAITLTAEVTLSPATNSVSVCFGDKLELTCSSNTTFLRWIISDPQDPGDRELTVVAPHTNSGTLTLPQLVIDSVAYNFTARLDPETSNLVTTLTVGNVTTNLSETVINCTELGSKTSEMLIVSIISAMDKGKCEPIIVLCLVSKLE